MIKYLTLTFFIIIGCFHIRTINKNSKHHKPYSFYNFASLNSINNMIYNKKNPPDAKKIPKELIIHGHKRVDNYYWLNDKENPEVIKYLKEENKYTGEALKDTKLLQKKLYNEITSRIKHDDMSVPYQKKGYYYYTRFEANKEYPIYCRKKETLENQEEIMLDVNELVKEHSYYDVMGLSLSPDKKLLAFGVDEIGRRNYTIYVKNLDKKIIIKTDITNTTGTATWANDNKTIFYVKKNEITLRPFQIYKTEVISNDKNQVLVYEEKDEIYSTFVYKTKSDKYIVISSHSTLSDEYQILDANNPESMFRIFHPREKNLEYSISHIGDKFYIKTNYEAENFRIMETSEKTTNKKYWTEVIPHRSDVLIESIDVFNNFLVIGERVNAQQKLRIMNLKDSSDHYIRIDEEAYSIYTSINPELDTDILRFGFNSLTTPSSIFDYNMISKEKVLLKQQEIIGDFNPKNYRSKRLFAIAEDGEEIPISLVYHKNVNPQNKNPLLLYGYGSYGYTIDPHFSVARLSLLDRGFIYAIAHIRGGEIKGRRWYEDGKMLQKKNTFSDFIACAKFLINEHYTSNEKLYAIGGSAGGLLMGAVVNMAPELFNGIVASVPFVDVVTTMLDENIPLTTGEYDEWGNPNIKEYYDYMLSYSPYDNVEAKNYPSMLVTTGLYDSQVQYWEPAKWVAKLRDMKTDDHILLLYTDMESGHSGTTGRFKIYKDTAIEYAFLFMLEGIKE